MSSASSTPKSSGIRRLFKHDDFDLLTPVTSHFVSPGTLLSVRAFLTTYAVIVVLATFITSFPNPLRGYFAYFTNLSYLGLTGYLCAATYHSYRYYRQGSAYLTSSRIAKSPVALFIYWLAYHCIVVYHIVVPVVYWGTLYKPGMTMTKINWWTTTSCHGLDFVFMFIEFLLCRWVLRLPFFLIALSIVVVYMFWSWIIYAIYHVWVYGFLDWSKSPGIVAGSYIGVAAAFVVVCGLMYGLHYLRDYIAKKYCTSDDSSALYIQAKESKVDVEMG